MPKPAKGTKTAPLFSFYPVPPLFKNAWSFGTIDALI
jgi:hypothetical protein